MEPKKLLEILSVAERLKDTLRHCDTSGGRRESVAEHCWRASLMAWLLRDQFPEADMNKVIAMCLVHDLGEAFTGDIPVFEKTDADEAQEDALLQQWLRTVPEPYGSELQALFSEMAQRTSQEAKIFKAIDGLEALIQHNEADLQTWLPNEYALQQNYAWDRVGFSPYLTQLRRQVLEDTDRKIREGS